MAKSGLFGLKAVLGVSSIALGLATGSAMATTVNSTVVSLPDGTTTVNITDTNQTVDGNGSNLTTGMIQLQTNIGVLNTYCVDLFDYITVGNPSNNSFNLNPLAAGSVYQNGTTTGSFTAAQVHTITALLTNGTLQTQNTVNTAALQLAIWDVEYDTAAANGSYNLTTHDSFYFSATGDSNSAATLTQAQAYLNDATGYMNGSTWVAATWLTNSSHFVEFLTSTTGSVQDLVYLATPEPSTIALFGVGVIGLVAARRRKLI